MQISVEGLIIREQNVGEADKVVSILSKELGVCRAFVTGARQLKNKNSSSTSLFCYSRLVLYKGRDTYRINEADLIEVFFPLRQDLIKMAAAQYFCSLALILAPEEERAEDFLRLLLNVFHLLAKGEKKVLMLKAVTELRLLTFAGYMPNLISCAGCESSGCQEIYFSAAKGEMYCADCIKDKNGLLFVPKGVLLAMRHILYSDLNRLFSFNLSDEGLASLANICEHFLLSQTEHKFKTLDFLKPLL